MLRLSFRELEWVSLWYCKGVYCVCSQEGSGGMLP